MGQILRIGFFFWLGAAATTTVIMVVIAMVSLVKNDKLPEQDIPYWQGLLIYLPINAIPAAVFAITAAISSSIGILPLISTTGSGLVGSMAAGTMQVIVAAISLSRNYDNEEQEEQRQLSKLEDEQELTRRLETMLRYASNPPQQAEQQMIVPEQQPGSSPQMAISIPVLVFLVLPIVLYFCVQLLSVWA